MNTVVTGCSDCCLCQEEAAEYFCRHPSVEYKKIQIDDSGDDLSYIEFPVTPDWCPLNKEAITVTKEKMIIPQGIVDFVNNQKEL